MLIDTANLTPAQLAALGLNVDGTMPVALNPMALTVKNVASDIATAASLVPGRTASTVEAVAEGVEAAAPTISAVASDVALLVSFVQRMWGDLFAAHVATTTAK